MFGSVIIEIRVCPAHYYCIGLVLLGSRSQFRQMNCQSLWPPHKPIYVFRNIIACHRGDFSLEFKLAFDLAVPFCARQGRNIRFVAQQIIDDQYLCMLDLFFDRLVSAKSTFVVRKRQLFRFGWLNCGIQHKPYELSKYPAKLQTPYDRPVSLSTKQANSLFYF